MSSNVSTTFITCPADPSKTLGIKLPFLVMIIKNLKKYFSFEVQVLDDKNVRRRFRASNYQVGAEGGLVLAVHSDCMFGDSFMLYGLQPSQVAATRSAAQCTMFHS
jgi:hypothetical protein